MGKTEVMTKLKEVDKTPELFQIFTSSTVYLAIIGTTGVTLNLSVIFLFLCYKNVLSDDVIVEGRPFTPLFLVTHRFQLFTPQPHHHRAGRVLYRNPGGRCGLLPAWLEDGARHLSDHWLLSHTPR